MASSILFRIKAKIDNKRRRKAAAAAVSLPATDSVLNTYELLEGILGHLDARSLRKAQIVCTAWNDMIVHSSRRLAAARDAGLEGKLRRFGLGLVGADRSGKKSLHMQWALNTYIPTEMYDPTTEEVGFRKQLRFDNDIWHVELLGINSPISLGNPIPPSGLPASILWDGLSLHWLRAIDAYVLVYSVTDRIAFTRLRLLAENLKAVLAEMEQQQQSQNKDQQYQHQQQHQHQQLQLQQRETPRNRPINRPAKNRPLALIATKCDLDSLVSGDWDVTHEEGVTLAAELGCPFYETSARSGEGVDECFDGVLREYKEERLRICREESERRVDLKGKNGIGVAEGFGEVEGREGAAGGNRRRRYSVWDKRKLGLVARKFRGDEKAD